MKAKRQQEILRIIEEQDIDTQDQLLTELKARGVQSTQATISRDIKELHLIKELTSYGTYRYAVSERKASLNFAGRLRTIFKEGVTSFDVAQNIVVLKTMPGLASAACAAIDGMDIGTQAGAAAALDQIKDAINYVSDVRGTLGATQNRLDHTINNLSVMQENIQDAESTIRDTDIADEMMSYTKNNILIQSAQAMLAQANSVPQGVLQLLQ